MRKIKEKSEKIKKIVPILLLLTLFGCTSWFESINNEGEATGKAFIRLLLIQKLISTYKFIYNVYPENITQIDSFITSEDFPCYGQKEYNLDVKIGWYSELEIFNSSDSLIQLRIFLNPIIEENKVLRSYGGFITIYPIRQDSTFEFRIDSIYSHYTSSLVTTSEDDGRITESIIKCK